MIYLQDLVNYNFILFDAEQVVAQATAVAQRLKPTRIIVRRWDNGSIYHYLYAAQTFCDRLAQADGNRALVDALALHEGDATPTLDAWQDAESAPSRCVITEGDRVLGFYDAALPPVWDITRGSTTESTSPPLVSRALQAEFPERVPLGQTASMLVWLTQQLGRPSALPIAVPVGTRLDIVVQAQSGFVLEGTGDGSLLVTDEAETLPLQFKLRASEIGPVRLRVLCFQNGQPLGAMTLAALVVAADQEAAGQRHSTGRPLAPLTLAQPDLTLLIFERVDQGQSVITLRLSAVDPALGLNFKSFGPIRLRLDPLRYFQDFFGDIEGLPLRTAEEQAIATRKLALKGARLFQDLLPDDLRVLLWSLRDRIRTVQVLSDEPWIPWELLKLQGQENGRTVEGPFLCEAFALTRWFPGIGRRPELRLQRLAVVIPTDSGLPCAPQERDYLRALASGQRQVTEISASYLDVVDALSRGEHDGWHFSGHGQFVAPDPNRSAILLEDKQRLCAEEICGQVSNCGLASPLVFLNACQTGREALSLTGMGGWAKGFVEAGAAGFVGSLWSVYDEAACQFAKAFYNHLLAGETIGQAARAARAAIRPLNDSTWLAYTVFADPLAMVRKEV